MAFNAIITEIDDIMFFKLRLTKKGMIDSPYV